MVDSCSVYLDTSGDSGWPAPFGRSQVNWYILAGLVLRPDTDHQAFTEINRILAKYITNTERSKFPDKFYEIHYHDIVIGKNIYQGLTGLQRKAMSDEIFDLILRLKPVLFATAINKIQLKRCYGSYAFAPKTLALRATIHRFSIYLERENMIGSIIVDEEEYRKDKELQTMIHNFRRHGITLRGDDYQPLLENKLKNILNTISFAPSHQSAGIQLADVCCRATWTHLERNKSERFIQLSSLWDRNENMVYEPSLFPPKNRWI